MMWVSAVTGQRGELRRGGGAGRRGSPRPIGKTLEARAAISPVGLPDDPGSGPCHSPRRLPRTAVPARLRSSTPLPPIGACPDQGELGGVLQRRDAGREEDRAAAERAARLYHTATTPRRRHRDLPTKIERPRRWTQP